MYALYDDNTKALCAGTPKPEAEFFYWNDSNVTWTDISATLPNEPGCSDGNDPFAHQGGYDLVVAVKPDDANTIFIGGTNAYRSTNTGATWTRIGGYDNPNDAAQYENSHSDIHYFVFQPGSSTTMLCGNDGGIQRTTDVLATNPRVVWTPINNGFRTYQYYYVAIDPRSGNNKVIGGAQDNGTTRNIGGTGSAFEPVFSGDGVSVGLSDPAATGGVQYEYVGFQNGGVHRRDASQGNGFGTDIKPTGSGAGLFITLFKLDSDNTQTLYYANANNLYRTTSASTVAPNSWTQMTGIGTAVGAGVNITAFGLTRGAYNPASSKLFFGTEDARVFRLNDPTGAAANAAPVNISGAAFPAGAYVSSIAVSPTNSNEVMVTFSNYGVASVFWTNNADAATPTWQNVENNLPIPSYRSSAILTINGTTEYFVGTSTGLYRIAGSPVSGTWIKEGPTTIGNAVVSSLDARISDNKLLVGTHGIGMLISAAPTAATVSVSGRVLTPAGTGLRNAIVTLIDEAGTQRTARTSGFGYYRFDDVPAGGSVVVSVSSKIYRFEAQAFSVTGEVNNLNFTASK